MAHILQLNLLLYPFCCSILYASICSSWNHPCYNANHKGLNKRKQRNKWQNGIGGRMQQEVQQ